MPSYANNKRIKVAVHDGIFHSDDVFAVAILSLCLNKPLRIFRTRDQKIFAKMDYLLDVGGEYDPKKHRFDHHQKGWNEKRENGILYATSGLMWKEYGEKITGSREVVKRIDEKIIQCIDAEDNGTETYKHIFKDVNLYEIFDYINAFNPTWAEKTANSLKSFEKVVIFAKEILKREIKKTEDDILGEKKVQEIYRKTKDKRIIVLDENYSWRKVIGSHPEPLFIIKPNGNKKWYVNAVNLEDSRFNNRIDFPWNWAGKHGEELAKVSGVSDADFCHNRRFMCAAKSKEGAIALAKRAIELGLKSS